MKIEKLEEKKAQLLEEQRKLKEQEKEIEKQLKQERLKEQKKISTDFGMRILKKYKIATKAGAKEFERKIEELLQNQSQKISLSEETYFQLNQLESNLKKNLFENQYLDYRAAYQETLQLIEALKKELNL